MFLTYYLNETLDGALMRYFTISLMYLLSAHAKIGENIKCKRKNCFGHKDPVCSRTGLGISWRLLLPLSRSVLIWCHHNLADCSVWWISLCYIKGQYSIENTLVARQLTITLRNMNGEVWWPDDCHYNYTHIWSKRGSQIDHWGHNCKQANNTCKILDAKPYYRSVSELPWCWYKDAGGYDAIFL